MARIDYYFDTISPFTYLAGTRLEEIATRHGVAISYKPLDLSALFSRTGGVATAERHPARQEYRLIEIERQAVANGLAVNPKPMFFPTNPAPSSYAIIAAQSAGGGDMGVLVHSILRACWAEEKNVADDEVIKACLSAAGFDPGLADSGLLSGAEVYGRNLEDAVSAGVFGAPFYVVGDGARFWGQDRLDELDHYLAAD